MKLNMISKMTPLVGIDLGSSRTRVWHGDEEIIDEATCVAIDSGNKKVLAVGDEAADLSGRVGDNIQILHPIVGGELADDDVLRALLKVLLQRIFSSLTLFRPVIMVSLPHHLSPAKREVTVSLLYSLGAREVITMSQPLAAAIGSGVPIADASGSLVAQFGAGVVEMAIISLGSIVIGKHNFEAGQSLDEKLVMAVKETSNLIISKGSARQLKHNIATLEPVDNRMMISGQDAIKGSPKEMEISSTSLRPILLASAKNYSNLLKEVLSEVPPELTVDVIDKGILLSGGMAPLGGLNTYLIETLGVPAAVVEEPDEVVIKGLATALEHLDEFKQSLGYEG